MKHFLIATLFFSSFSLHAQYRVYAPHYPEGILTEHIDTGKIHIVFRPIDGTRKTFVNKKYVTKITCPNGEEMVNPNPKIAKCFNLPINPRTARIHFKDSIQIDSLQAAEIKKKVRDWSFSHMELLPSLETLNPNWEIILRSRSTAFFDGDEHKVFFDIHVKYTQYQLYLELTDFNFLYAELVQDFYPGPVNNYSDYPSKFTKDLNRKYTWVVYGDDLEIFWIPFKSSLWQVIQGFHDLNGSRPPYEKFDLPVHKQAAEIAQLVTNNRLTTDIRHHGIEGNTLKYSLVDDPQEYTRAIELKNVYSIAQNQKVTVYSHRSRFKARKSLPSGNTFIFDQNGIFLDLLGGHGKFAWAEGAPTSGIQIDNNHQLTSVGFRFGNILHFTGVPDLYSPGVQFSLQNTMAFNSSLTVNNPALSIGLTNSFKLGENAALRLNTSFGLSAFFWDLTSDYVAIIVYPRKSVGAVLISPEMKFIHKKLSCGLGYDFNVFPNAQYLNMQAHRFMFSLGVQF